jgi:radical SAM superfamily enzyme YgiQ (UPF0313 family)
MKIKMTRSAGRGDTMVNKNKVLLITSTSTSSTIQDSISISYGLHLLKNKLNRQHIECDIIDLEIMTENESLENVRVGMYNIIGMSVTHCNMKADLAFLHALKTTVNETKRNCLFIAGGMSATLDHQTWLRGGFDVICLGYAEETLVKLCETYSPSVDLEPFRLHLNEIDGVAFRDNNGGIIFNPSIPLSKEEFENKMYTLAMEMEVPYNQYWKFMKRKGTGSLSINNRSYVIENARLYTSSKCLAKCGYCCCPAFLPISQQTVAKSLMLSAEQVHNLVVYHVHKYKARSFSFNDEDFLIGNKQGINRAIMFCDLIMGSKRKGEIPEEIKFSCQTRASDFLKKDVKNKSVVNHRLIKKMADTKFHNVSLGIETFSERLIGCPSINKPKVSVRDYHNVLDAMMKQGLFPTINLIIGIPEETPTELINTIEETMAYVDKPCQVSVSTKMSAFPGAPISNSEDYPTHNIQWENPISKEIIRIPDYFIPRDKILAKMIESLEQDKLIELENLRKRHNMSQSEIIPRIGISLCTFSVIAKKLGCDVLNIKINNKIDQLLIDNRKSQSVRSETLFRKQEKFS